MKPIPKEEVEILQLFYRTQLRLYEDVIDNQSPTIAKELNLKISMVNQTLDRELKRKIKTLDDSLIIEIKPLEIEELEVSDLEVVQSISKEVIKKRRIKENFSIDANFYFNP